MKQMILFLLLIAIFPSLAQTREKAIAYLDQKGAHLRDSSSHVYYYKTVQPVGKIFKVRSYIAANRVLLMEAECSVYTPVIVHNGKTSFYHENGKLKMEGFFKDNAPVGTHRLFYANGRLEKVVEYGPEGIRMLHAFSEDGVDFLKDRNDLIGRLVHENPADTIREKQAEYAGGLQRLAAFVGRNMKYPAAARKAGAAGKVYISFIIDNDGHHHHHQVVQGFHPDCDEEALRVVSKMPDWVPATINNQPVSSAFVFPLTFRIDN